MELLLLVLLPVLVLVVMIQDRKESKRRGKGPGWSTLREGEYEADFSKCEDMCAGQTYDIPFVLKKRR